MDDLQFRANQKTIALDAAIARYDWRDDFSKMVSAIEDDDPDSIAAAASASESTANIRFSGLIYADTQRRN